MVNRFLKYLLIIYTFFLPLQTRLFLIDSGVEYQRVSLYGTQIFFALIVILFLILEAKRKSEIRNTKSETISKSLFTNHHSLFTLLILFVSIQLVSSSRIYLSIQTLLWIAQALLFIWIVRREKLERMVLWTFIISMCAQSTFIWIQVFTQYIPAFKWLGLAEQVSSVGGVSVVETVSGRFLRGYGSFPHPNIAGGYLLIAILALSKLQITNPKSQTNLNNQSPNIQNKWITSLEFGILNLNIVWNLVLGVWNFIRLRVTCYVVCALLISALVLTFSRSAMLGLIIFIVIEFILPFRSLNRNPEIKNKQKQTVIASSDVASERGDLTKAENRQGKIARPDSRQSRQASSQSLLAMTIFILLVFITIAIQFRELTFPRTNISNRLESKSIVERQLYSDQAKDIIKDNLWFGAGLGNYTVELQQRYANREVYEYQPPHNVVLLAFSELGIVGITLILLVFLMWLRIRYYVSGIRGEIHNNQLRYTLYVIRYTLVRAFVPILLFDHYLWSLYAGWILIGMIVLSVLFASDTIQSEYEKGLFSHHEPKQSERG